TLDRPVTLKVPPGTRSGRVFRVRGRGVPGSHGAGDLLVTVEVAVPEQLTPEQQEAVASLSGLLDGESLRRASLGDA
ncbi:MAG TPA: DnaJ C-terminal domain-containing protein, partial [Acidimicrobiales bacterium]|nr:DnaJ C-terminal domain-containing protein [Acidimicrobiales bacterium]